MYSGKSTFFIFVVIFSVSWVQGKNDSSGKKLPEGYVSFPIFHAAYKVYEIPSTWYEARDKCIKDGGYLAIVDTKPKIAQINRMRKVPTKFLHVGIFWSALTSNWLKINDFKPPGAILWTKHAPDAKAGCVGMSTKGNDEQFYGYLIDYSCKQPGDYFVCEIPIKG